MIGYLRQRMRMRETGGFRSPQKMDLTPLMTSLAARADVDLESLPCTTLGPDLVVQKTLAWEASRSLSEEARTILQVVLDDEVRVFKSGKPVKAAIVEYLRGLGWPWKVIDLAWAELQTWVRMF